MKEKHFTIRELADAIEKNGLPQAFGQMVKTNYRSSSQIMLMSRWEPGEKIVSACALGQAGINLGVDPYSIYGDVPVGEDEVSVTEFVVAYNDEEQWSFSQIAQRLREEFAPFLDEPVMSAEELDLSPYI